MNRLVKPPTTEQHTELAEWVRLGMSIMAHYGVSETLTLYENLDAVYEAWLEDEADNAPDAATIVTGLGAVFGDRLARKHKTDWVTVSDEHGDNFALVINGYEIYPLSFVAKRVAQLEEEEEEIETGFFSGFDAVIDEQFASKT